MRTPLFWVSLLLSLGCISPNVDDPVSAAPEGNELLRAGAMLCSNGQDASAENGGGGEVYCNRDDPADWERFTLVDLGGGWYAIQTFAGSYLRAINRGGGDVDARASDIQSWETTPSPRA